MIRCRRSTGSAIPPASSTRSDDLFCGSRPALVAFVALLFQLFPPITAGTEPGHDFEYFTDRQRIEDPRAALQLFRQASASAAPQINRFKPPFFAGNIKQRFWIHTRLSNPGNARLVRRLLLPVPSRYRLNAYAVDADAQVSPLIRQSIHHTFEQRNYPHRWLVSPQIELRPGESTDILIQFQSVAGSFMPIQLVTPKTYLEIVRSDNTRAAIFYSTSLTVILMFFWFGAAVRDRTSIQFAALFLVGLLMMASREGFAFPLLWPDFPVWNHYAPLVLTYAFISTGFLVAAFAVEPTEYLQGLSQRVRKLFLMLALLSLAMIAPAFVWPFEIFRFSSVFFVAMFVSLAWTLYSWSRTTPRNDLKRNRVAFFGAVFLAALAAVLLLTSSEQDGFDLLWKLNSDRVFFIVATLITMATILSHVYGLRQDYAASLEQAVKSAQREARINHELFEAEQKYTRARELASRRQQQLAEASHDIRQPLVSLRSSVDVILRDQPPRIRSQLDHAFNYLENLCNTYLHETRPENPSQESSTGTQTTTAPGSANAECYALNLIMETVGRMFSDEAAKRSTRLRIRTSSTLTDSPPTVVMRIVSNLVSNAIRHAQADKILLGVRRRPHGAMILVMDNGRGIAADILEDLFNPYHKGSESSGEGLGLAICAQLAEQHNMHLDIRSEPGRGSCFTLAVNRPGGIAGPPQNDPAKPGD